MQTRIASRGTRTRQRLLCQSHLRLSRNGGVHGRGTAASTDSDQARQRIVAHKSRLIPNASFPTRRRARASPNYAGGSRAVLAAMRAVWLRRRLIERLDWRRDDDRPANFFQRASGPEAPFYPERWRERAREKGRKKVTSHLWWTSARAICRGTNCAQPEWRAVFCRKFPGPLRATTRA